MNIWVFFEQFFEEQFLVELLPNFKKKTKKCKETKNTTVCHLAAFINYHKIINFLSFNQGASLTTINIYKTYTTPLTGIDADWYNYNIFIALYRKLKTKQKIYFIHFKEWLQNFSYFGCIYLKYCVSVFFVLYFLYKLYISNKHTIFEFKIYILLKVSVKYYSWHTHWGN